MERRSDPTVKRGDRVLVESEKVGQPERCGTVVSTGRFLLIRWDDGTQSLYSPSAGALRVAEPGDRSSTTRDPTQG
jgi:hypothetical protein